MYTIDFPRMHRSLLLGGVSPKYAARTIQEVRQHLETLTQENMSRGQTENTALENAYQQLGTEDTLIAQVLSKPELRSWSFKYTKTIFMLAPLSLYLVIVIASGFLLGGYAIETIDTGWPVWFVWVSKTWMTAIEFVITPLLALLFCVLAKQRNVPLLWPVAGIAILSFLGSGWDMTIALPSNGREAEISMHWGYAIMPWRMVQTEWASTVIQLAQCFATIALALIVLRRYRPLEQKQGSTNSA